MDDDRNKLTDWRNPLCNSRGEKPMQREIVSAISSEAVKATPTAAAVAASTLLAQELDLYLRLLMYATAIILAVVQTVIAIKRGRREAQQIKATVPAPASVQPPA